MSLYRLVSSNLLMIMSSDECHSTLRMISEHWFRWWLGAVRQQAMTWTSVDQDLQRHMASLSPNEVGCQQKGCVPTLGPWYTKACITACYQGLCLLSGKTSYHKISWILQAARFGFKHINIKKWWDGNTFRITGSFWEDSTVAVEFPSQRNSRAKLRSFLCC